MLFRSPAILICAPRFVGRDFSSMQSTTEPCRHAMTVCFGACTRRRVSVRTVNSPSLVTATIPRGSATARATATDQSVLFYSPLLTGTASPRPSIGSIFAGGQGIWRLLTCCGLAQCNPDEMSDAGGGRSAWTAWTAGSQPAAGPTTGPIPMSLSRVANRTASTWIGGSRAAIRASHACGKPAAGPSDRRMGTGS